MNEQHVVSRRALLAAAAAVVVGAAACSDDRRSSPSTTLQPTTVPPEPEVAASTTTLPVQQSGEYVPPAGDEWATTTAAEAGFTDDGLAAVVQLVADSNSSSFTIVHEGRLVTEQYWMTATPDTAGDVASAQKSVVSTLVGLARDRGLLTLDDPVTDHLGSGWTNATPAEERSITVRHLLTMTSGLDERTLRAAQPAGTVWAYNTEAYQKLRLVLEAAADTDINSVTSEWLFQPIGIENSTAWTPRPGAAADAVGAAQWGLNLRAREMARYGLFAMRNGNWGGTQVTDPGWFAEAWTPIPQKADYGYLWWLLGRGMLGRRGAPRDLVAALGAQDQKIYVVPSLGLVITRQGLAAKDVTLAISDFDTRLMIAIGDARA